ncbi:putative Tryptophanase [Rhypophila decipiens]|uniref:Tryptophanase n=1 Tax=Rhypophila decipiens TaxID=261697 RepID=A0AAN7B0C3_9PEZI|nr:putative Tryptophanase [Rhypophila decipiens]
MAITSTSGAPLQPPAHFALVVRSLPKVTAEDRDKILKDVEYNVFAFPAGLLTCDFLSDSGTSAMTDFQWAAVMRGDESYGRNWGYYCLLEVFRDIFERGSQHQQRAIRDVLAGTVAPMSEADFYRSRLLGLASQRGFVNGGHHQLARPNFFIVPQGRCAETLLFSTMSSLIARERQDPAPRSPVIISNGFFDTTGANAKAAGFELQTFTQPGLTDPFPQDLIGKENNFKGNLDLEATQVFLSNNAGRVSMLLLTITNNWAAAQPVSMTNIRGAASLARTFNIPFFFDACRFAENAYFIQRYEDGYANVDILDIVKEMFSYVDGFTISLKKDGLANMGGVLCFRDEGVFAQRYQGVGMLLKESQIRCYGNDSYGGMSGRDLMAAAAGLYQVTKTSYLANRITQVQHFAERLLAEGIAVLSPPGGHAVYLDMDAYFFGCARKPEDFASAGFTIQLIRDHGIRAAEAGPFGWEYDLKAADDPERAKIPNLVRFAVPRNVYSDEHISYTVAAIKDLHKRRHTDIPNVVITRGKNMRLRHFSAGLKPIMPTTTTKGAWLDEAQRSLGNLFQAVGLDQNGRKELSKALTVVMGAWGQTPVEQSSSWTSSVGNDGSPIEFSVAVDPTTGEAELRLLAEAQPSPSDKTNNNLNHLWARLSSAALKLNDTISAEYKPSISLARFSQIRDLFLPSSLPADKQTIKLAAWHSFAYSARKGPQWKLYLDPSNAADGYTALSSTREAFTRLGLYSAWKSVESILGPSDSVVYFSLDLTGKVDSSARVKVYMAHSVDKQQMTPATFRSQAAIIADKHAKLCGHYPESIPVDGYEIQRFIAAMSGPDFDKTDLDLGNRKPLLSCFAFTTTRSDREAPTAVLANTTVHFPMDAYVPDDEEAHRRTEAYYSASANEAKDIYNKVLGAVQTRPLNKAKGIHAWVSLKQNVTSKTGSDDTKKGAGVENTFYFCPEILGGK